VCRAVFEIPTPAAALAVPVVVEKRRGRKGKQAATSTATVSASSLPVNLFASSVLVTAASGSSAEKVNPNEIKCEICEDGEEDATSFCVQCAQYFCSGCQRGHKRIKTTTGHEFVSVDKALKGKMKALVVHCERHHLEINTYCHTDRQVICPECILDHKEHKIDRLVNLVQGFKEEIAQLVDKVSFFLSSFLSSSSFLL